MALYWRIKSVPELTNLPGRERRAVYRLCQKRASRDGAFVMAYIWLVLPMGVLLVLVSACMHYFGVLNHWGDNTFIIDLAAGFIVVAFPTVLAARALEIKILRPYIREYLSSGV